MSMEGKVVLVTGGSRGIGRAVCLEMAQRGADIALCYAGNEAAAQDTAQACREKGAQVLVLRCDVSRSEAVKAMVDTVVKTLGRIDVLVNNAGITRDGLIMAMSEENFDAVIAANLKGTFLCIKAVCRLMVRQRSGRIVNISSVVGLHGNAGQANYAASKAGVIGLTKSAARELAPRGITVNAVAPGYIETDMTAVLPEDVKNRLQGTIPAARLGEAQEVAQAVAFLVSDEAAYITGQVLAVDGGMSM